MICRANQLTGFYMMATLSFNESITKHFNMTNYWHGYADVHVILSPFKQLERLEILARSEKSKKKNLKKIQL